MIYPRRGLAQLSFSFYLSLLPISQNFFGYSRKMLKERIQSPAPLNAMERNLPTV